MFCIPSKSQVFFASYSCMPDSNRFWVSKGHHLSFLSWWYECINHSHCIALAFCSLDILHQPYRFQLGSGQVVSNLCLCKWMYSDQNLLLICIKMFIKISLKSHFTCNWQASTKKNYRMIHRMSTGSVETGEGHEEYLSKWSDQLCVSVQ